MWASVLVQIATAPIDGSFHMRSRDSATGMSNFDPTNPAAPANVS